MGLRTTVLQGTQGAWMASAMAFYLSLLLALLVMEMVMELFTEMTARSSVTIA